MDFSFTVQEEQFRQEFRTWLEENLPDGWLQGEFQLDKESKEYELFLREWQRKLYEGGWAGETDGGNCLSTRDGTRKSSAID